MKQSRRVSLIEAISNTVLGYGIAVLTQMVVYPLFDMEVTFSENILLAAIFTIVSFIRNYIWRRFFVWIHLG